MKTKEKEIRINGEELRNLLHNARKAMYAHQFSGWGIYTLFNTEDGSVSNGDCVNISTTYPDNFLSLNFSEKWEISDDDENNACDNHECRSWKLLNGNDELEEAIYCEECQNAYVDDYVDFVMEKITREERFELC